MPFTSGYHHAQFRIYYEDTDAGGIVYHANYLKYAERARTDALRELDIHQRCLREEMGIFFVLRHADITYLKPIMLDDLITVTSEITHIGNTSLKMKQCIWRDDIEICQMLMHIVCINDDKKPVRMPGAVLQPLKKNMMKEKN